MIFFLKAKLKGFTVDHIHVHTGRFLRKYLYPVNGTEDSRELLKAMQEYIFVQ